MNQVLEIILVALATAAAGLITWGFTMLKAFLNNKVKNEKLRDVLNAASDAVEAAVLSVNQTFVDTLKEEGKFDKEKQKEALNLAVKRALASLTKEAKDLLEENFGNVEEWLITQIEALINTFN